jgi:DNA-binding FrmR family transcriptional regulator
MSFSFTERTTLLHRLRCIQGQFEGVERAIERESSCTHLLCLIATARSAVDGFLVSVIEHHLRSHLVEEGAERTEAINETIKMTQLYLR